MPCHGGGGEGPKEEGNFRPTGGGAELIKVRWHSV